jgi:general stress protein YciG
MSKKVNKNTSKAERKSMAASLGRMGGKAVAKKHGKSYMKEIGRKGAKARWANENRNTTKE